jgi:hypothetical protein
MHARWVKFPVTCPSCGSEFLSALRVAEVREALSCGRPIRLFASCHRRHWFADESESQRIRDHLVTLDALTRTPTGREAMGSRTPE